MTSTVSKRGVMHPSRAGERFFQATMHALIVKFRWLILAVVAAIGLVVGYVAISHLQTEQTDKLTLQDLSIQEIMKLPRAETRGFARANRLCAWSIRPAASLKLPLNVTIEGAKVVELEYRPFLHKKHRRQAIHVSVNGQELNALQHSGSSARWVTHQIPVRGQNLARIKRTLDLNFTFPTAISHKALGIGPTAAERAICLRRVRVIAWRN